MPTTADILLRDHVRYSGDGKPNEPVGEPAPIGDPSSGGHNPSKKDFRDALNSVTGAADVANDAADRANLAAELLEPASGHITYLRGRTTVEVVAHRGFARQNPENTSLAFTNALAQGADSLEADLQITSDGQVVCYHDDTLDTLTNGTGEVKDVTLSYVRARTFTATAGTPYSALKIPTFNEFVEIIRKYRVLAYVEIKKYRAQTDIGLIVNNIVASGLEDYFIICSFSLSDIQYARSLNPRIKVALLSGNVEANWQALVNSLVPLKPAMLQPNLDIAEAWGGVTFTEWVYDRGIDLSTWTINNQDAFTRSTDIGIYKMIADRSLNKTGGE